MSAGDVTQDLAAYLKILNATTTATGTTTGGTYTLPTGGTSGQVLMTTTVGSTIPLTWSNYHPWANTPADVWKHHGVLRDEYGRTEYAVVKAAHWRDDAVLGKVLVLEVVGGTFTIPLDAVRELFEPLMLEMFR